MTLTVLYKIKICTNMVLYIINLLMAKRGGAREGSGRPSPWRHSQTQLVRIPEVLVTQVLEYARKLDAGEDSESEQYQIDLVAIADQVLSDPSVTRNGKDTGAARRAVTAFIERLRAETAISTPSD